ncbi:hypothetical protein ABIE41_002150 [Bosea sp. OAE506]|uniref:hypothetical protein n=1 Tax=Bosea sp. OAE506 TaxID=2663870 RepID=UPI0017898F05
MSALLKIHSDIAEARERLDTLTEAAELALDRGRRGPTPAEIERARYLLAHFERQLELAGGAAASVPLTHRSTR